MNKALKVSREEELLRNAIRMFSQGGFRETSLQDLADQLNITRPLFYYYFESKEELLWRIIGHLGDSLLEQSRPIAASDDRPIRRLERLFETHVQSLIENVDAYRIYFAERHNLKGKQDLRLKRGESLYHDVISDVIAEAQAAGEVPPGDPHLLARLSMGSANAILRWYVPTGTIPPTTLVPATVEFVIRGLATPESN